MTAFVNELIEKLVSLNSENSFSLCHLTRVVTFILFKKKLKTKNELETNYFYRIERQLPLLHCLHRQFCSTFSPQRTSLAMNEPEVFPDT